MVANTSSDLNTIILGYEARFTQLEDALRVMYNKNSGVANIVAPTQVKASSVKPNKPLAFTTDKNGPIADT